MVLTAHEDDRLARATASLIGLSVGDAFGETFFDEPMDSRLRLAESGLVPGPWRYTDDTEMALSIFATLRRHGAIDQDELARSFAIRHDPWRGYGPAMNKLLPQIRDGHHWAAGARSLFGGAGSFGNGAAMRVAPLGAYLADDLAVVRREAERSAVVTHAHPEGVAGAIAVAVAAAQASGLRNAAELPDRRSFIDLVRQFIPESDVRRGLREARDLPPGAGVKEAVAALGNGSRVSAQDTVPFALWCVGERLGNYEQALWLAVGGAADVDTICAIVGGIMAAMTGEEGIPLAWQQAREPLPAWPFSDEPARG